MLQATSIEQHHHHHEMPTSGGALTSLGSARQSIDPLPAAVMAPRANGRRAITAGRPPAMSRNRQLSPFAGCPPAPAA